MDMATASCLRSQLRRSLRSRARVLPARPHKSGCVKMLWGERRGMAPSALFNGYRRSLPMSQQHCHFDASKSLTALEQDSTSQSKWLVAGHSPKKKRREEIVDLRT